MPSVRPRRTYIEVQANTPTANALGVMTPGWATVANLWGYVPPGFFGHERAIAGKTTGLLSYVVETRWPGSDSVVTPRHRLKVGTRYFNVTWTDNVEQRNEDLFIGCVERLDPAGD